MVSDYKITMGQAETEMACYRKVFDDVRLYDEAAVDALKKEDDCGEEQHPTHQCMGHVAVDAFYKKEELSKLEFIGDDIYQIMAKYLEIDGKPYVMELLKSMDKNYLVAQGDRDRLIRSLSGYNERLYSDVLTKVYNRRYFEEELKNQKGPAGIAMIDLDDFKLYNDTYGHKAGDMALATVTQVISRYIRKTDILVRYGGDEFLLIIPNVKEAEFTHRLQEILDRIHAATIPGYARIQLSVSIGGTIASADETIESVVGRADRFMYQAKTHKNLVVTETNEIRNQDEDGTEVDRNELKQQILIVDDSELNREILAEILHPDFKTMEACSGEECLSMLRQYGAGISLVLLDIVMPGMDGFAVLDEMNRNHWLEDIPVIMISSEDSEPYIRRAYELGVSDYINRPFDAKIVCQRVYNTIKLYAKQRKLVTLVTDQIYEKEKNNQMMISILSQIVEFRNGESGLHVLHINILSELLLERLVQKTDKYQISAQRRSLITMASALHDIGKIGIDDKILNKPGRLTPEEFDEMKKHTIIGESILKNVGIYQNEELVQLAMQICRWHHERYDGRGYPDGLKGEEIPIEVQVVSIADVYDALVSERVYKKAYSHKKAVEMILNGECGQFNPLLLECLQDIQDRIDEEFQNVENQSEEENQERKVHDQIMETTVLG